MHYGSSNNGSSNNGSSNNGTSRFLFLLLALPTALSAQARVVEGRVQRAADDGRPLPVARQWVVLHRVGSQGGAPVDSARTDAAGRYRIRYRATTSDADALYFVSARYAGIAYFTPPLRAGRISGGDADVMVFETSHDASAIKWQGRHLVVSAPRGDRREIAEIFEIENPSARTITARDSISPVWATVLPARAESAAVAPGDVSAAAVSFRPGRAELFAPVSPGVRQIAITYVLPSAAFPLSVPVERPVGVLEVLLEEPRATVDGGKLAPVAPATIDGRQFRRFLAQDVPAASVVRVSAPPPVTRNRNAMLALGIGVALIMLGAITIRLRRAPMAISPELMAISRAERLVAELAALDARYERLPATDASRASYEATRAKLKAAIEHELAAGTTPS